MDIRLGSDWYQRHFFPLGADISKPATGVPLWIFRFSQAMLLIGFGVFAFLAEKNQQEKNTTEADKEKAPVFE